MQQQTSKKARPSQLKEIQEDEDVVEYGPYLRRTSRKIKKNPTYANASLVEELIGCLLTCDPGLSCELVKRYISPSSACPNHYVGVIADEPSSTPYPEYINDVPRFIWNYLSDITSISKENGGAGCQDCNSRDEVCIKTEIDGKGVCVTSTTRYFVSLYLLTQLPIFKFYDIRLVMVLFDLFFIMRF